MTATTKQRLRSDRQRWAAARSLADLGELTALWLEGEILHQPGYRDPEPGEAGPDLETCDLVPVLAACNRAGFVTCGSQPGEVIAAGHNGAVWAQRAAVDGFCDAGTLGRIRAATAGDYLHIIAHDPATLPRFGFRSARAVTVTSRNGRRHTRFGVQLSRHHLRDAHVGYGECGREAVQSLLGAWQVTIVDPEWGRNAELWPALERFAGISL